MEENQLSDYEIVRDGNIKRNEAFVRSLGFGQIEEVAKISVPRKRNAETTLIGPQRFSHRQLSIKSTTDIICQKCNKTLTIPVGCTPGNVIGGHNSHCKVVERRTNRRNGHEKETEEENGNLEHEEAFEDNGIDIIEPVLSPISMLGYQNKLHENYHVESSSRPFDTRSLKANLKLTSSTWKHYALIYHHVVSKGLSKQDGEDLVVLFHNLHSLSGLEKRLSLPSYEAIHEAMTKNHHKNNIELRVFEQKFSTDYFRNVPLLKPFKGVHLDILHRIAEVLYFADPKFFFSEYTEQFNSSRERVIGDFASAECFRLLCKHVQDDKSLPINTVPLCIAISLDKTTLNSSRSRSETPVPFLIYNLSGDTERKSFKCEFIGYAPSLPESKNCLDSHLSETSHVKKHKKIAIKRAERQALLGFLGQLLKPLVDSRSRGLTFQVGNSSGKKLINVVPFLVAIIGDNEGSSQIAGVSTSKRLFRCRVCTQQDCSAFNLVPFDFLKTDNFRTDSIFEDLAQQGAAIELKRFSKQPLTHEEKTIEKEVERLNIAPSSDNPLYEAMRVTSLLCKRFGLHHEVPPDYLHTFVKGCIEYCLALVMAIMYSVQKLDDLKYSSNVSTLDRRIERANIDQTLHATKMCKFNKGISVFFTHENSKTTRNTGLMTGNLPAWKLKPLLILLQISIGEDETILPKSSKWCSDRCSEISRNWSILTTVHHAMSWTLEVNFALSKKQATLAELDRLHYLIHLNNHHL